MEKETGGTMNVNLPGVDFGRLAKQVIAEKITEGLFKSEEIVQGIVVEALTRKVDQNGQPSHYVNHQSDTWIEWLTKDVIRKSVLEVVKTRVESIRPQLEKAVEAALKASAKASAKVLVEGFVEQAKSGYATNVEIVLGIRERR